MVLGRSPWHGEVTDFLGLGGVSPVQVDCGSSIELAHGSRTVDISARARPWDREAPGFENQGAVDAGVQPLHKSGP